MRVRIKFAKYDTMRFIGHLDVMRYFHRLFNRSKLPVKYSEGYHPHQILSFAQPLGLGITSDGEYLDVEFTEELDLNEIVAKLNESVSSGFSIISALRLQDREVNRKVVTAMSLISRSVYVISLKDDVYSAHASELSDFTEKLKSFVNKESINVIKKSKKSEREINLKEFIYEVYNKNLEALYIDETKNAVVTPSLIEEGIKHMPDFDHDKQFVISLSAGSEANIAPDFFVECFINDAGFDLKPEDFRYHRVELFGESEKGSVSLCEIP